ncbi:Ig-like domain-containing protein [Lysinibacillus sp. UBA5990]|uniref:Ig-like domain-containing protein n=1 Tax=Lysinibacillus sp. UBA5990 TaxID=1946773 RepID=UPI0025C3ED04|nr:Ig-like domain-containing protein [Lysinibacillus sp. UBA5990]
MVNLFKKGFIYLAFTLLILVGISVESAHAEDGYSENLIPKMTSDVSEFGKASSSSNLGAYPSWKAFDGVENYSCGGGYCAWGTTQKTGWLAYEFSSPKAISKYVIHNNGSWPEKFPNTWTFEAWDGSNWVVLDSQSNVTKNDWKEKPSQSFTFENSSYYNKYRVNITLTNSKASTINTAISELQMMEKTSIPSEPESITLDKNNLELFEGDSEKLTATVSPDTANVIWTSSDESIATVDQNGNVTAIKEGVITVTAQVANINLIAECIVTVKKQGNAESESITLDRNILELLEGSQDKLTATISPEDSANKKVIWSSSDESIATVDQNGNVTAIREGETTIIAKVENTDLVATATVIVKKPINESSSAILSITLVNGITKEYDVSNTILNNYLNWFDSAQGTSTFKFSKTISPYKKVTEYIVHDKIASFEVREY